MAPPSFSDLGKPSRDIFDEGYNYGITSIQAKTKTDSGVNFKVTGNSSTDTGKVSGNFETKYKWSEYGLTFTEKWNTDNVLNTEIAIEDQLAKGLKLAFNTSFAPHTGKKSGKIKSAFKHENVNVNCDVDFDFAGPTIHGAAVLGYTGWLAGYQMSFDTSKSKFSKSNFAIGYKAGDFTLHTSVNDGQEFGGSVYQRVNKDLETAVNLAWTSGTNATTFGLGAKYTLDKNSSVNAKVNNSSQVGLGFTHNLRDGIQITVSSLIEGKNINAGGHKIGLGLEFEA